MGQVRTAIRSYALEGHSPRTVVGLVHDLLRATFDGQQMVTMLYVVVDPQTLEARIVNAGHPPPLVLQPGSGATFLEGPTGLPLGLSWDLPYAESLARLRSGSTLVLFTDGLVDRRDISVDEGLDRLQALASELADRDADGVCGALLDALVPTHASDDVAIVAARLEAARDRFRLRIPADPARLRTMRRSVGRWLSVLDVEPEVAQDVVLACGEACANAIEHAYGPGEGSVEIEASVTDGLLDVVVRDEGRWRPASNGDRGRGLRLMEACMDEVQIDRRSTGTSVRMRKALGIGVLV
jgi:anti-sigma regulatory factor (Ser/Thr protein kinase)